MVQIPENRTVPLSPILSSTRRTTVPAARDISLGLWMRLKGRETPGNSDSTPPTSTTGKADGGGAGRRRFVRIKILLSPGDLAELDELVRCVEQTMAEPASRSMVVRAALRAFHERLTGLDR